MSDSRNPPLPLDLDVPYNDDFSVYQRDQQHVNGPATVQAGFAPAPKPAPPSRKAILVSDYNPSSDFNLRLNHTTGRNHHGIITSSYDLTAATAGPIGPAAPAAAPPPASSRPSHKTHVEIITKHGATKKPNIIGNNYHPPGPAPPPAVDAVDTVLVTSTTGGKNGVPHTPHSSAHHVARNANAPNSAESADGPQTSARAENRKVTCMLYLQADHTFFGKMGSEEASIEAITRHVQRANVIYKGTGECVGELAYVNLRWQTANEMLA